MTKIIRKRVGFVALLLVFVLCAVCLAGAAIRTYYRQAYPMRYGDVISAQAAENGLPVELVLAVIRTESSFQPDAVSNVGARGMMQLTEETFYWVKSHKEPQADTTFEDMYDPDTSIAYGTYLLKMLIEEFGSVENALCAYHAGWGNAKKWLADPSYSTDGRIVNIPFADTDAYVKKVMRTMNIYRDLYVKN